MLNYNLLLLVFLLLLRLFSNVSITLLNDFKKKKKKKQHDVLQRLVDKESKLDNKVNVTFSLSLEKMMWAWLSKSLCESLLTAGG